jgi:hypothetical protein
VAGVPRRQSGGLPILAIRCIGALRGTSPWCCDSPTRAGEKVFVYFCDGLALIHAHTGERIRTQLFVGALRASSYTFAIATLSQELPVWEAELNESYRELATHYNTCVIPTRVWKPRDKACVSYCLLS